MKTKVIVSSRKIWHKAKKLGVDKKFKKSIFLLQENIFHPSLNTEVLQPKSSGIWSFRVDRKIRAIFFYHDEKQTIEIINLTVHYH